MSRLAFTTTSGSAGRSEPAVASAAFFGLGGWLVVQGQLNLGQLVAAEIVLLAIVGSLGRFSFYIDSFYEMAVSASKVSDLTNVGVTFAPTRQPI